MGVFLDHFATWMVRTLMPPLQVLLQALAGFQLESRRLEHGLPVQHPIASAPEPALRSVMVPGAVLWERGCPRVLTAS